MTKLGNIHFRHPLENKRSSTDYIYYGEKEGNVYKVNPEELYINTETSTSYAILNEGILNSSLDNFIKIEYGTSLDSLTTLNTSSYEVNPKTAVIKFSSLPSGSNLHFWATYKGVGSIVWAEDVVSLQQATSVIDTETLYKDGSVVMTGNLNLGNYNINNVNNINVNGTVDGVDVSSHNHSGGQGGLIETNSIVNSAITTSKIADGAVTNDKISNVDGSKINNTSINFNKFTNSALTEIFGTIYPVGALYITVNNNVPALFPGTWEKVSSGRVLQGADSSHAAGSTIEAGLPNIKGTLYNIPVEDQRPYTGDGCLFAPSYNDGDSPENAQAHITKPRRTITFNAASGEVHMNNNTESYRNDVYGKNDTVQPPAYVVNIFKRVQ